MFVRVRGSVVDTVVPLSVIEEAENPKIPVPLAIRLLVTVRDDCTDDDSGGAASLLIAVKADPLTTDSPTEAEGLANIPVPPETPLSFITVFELNCGTLPGVTGPITVTFCASAAAAEQIRSRMARARRFIGKIPELR